MRGLESNWAGTSEVMIVVAQVQGVRYTQVRLAYLT